jgi:hypothetical protein
LLEKYPSKLIGRHGPKRRSANVWALAFRERRPSISQDEFERYQKLLSSYGRQPLARGRQLRYGLGRWLCGRRPFAPYLDRERWETACRTSTVA